MKNKKIYFLFLLSIFLSIINMKVEVFGFEVPSFKELKKIYEYDHSLPLNVDIRLIRESKWCRLYHIVYSSLNQERVSADLYLPKEVTGQKAKPSNKKEIMKERIRKKNIIASSPPWPIVFVVPGYGIDKSFASLFAGGDRGWTAYGLVVFAMESIYTGERRVEGKDFIASTPEELLKNMKQLIFDILRGVDYLMTRDDIDKNRIAFYGISLGAFSGSVAISIDDRFKAAILSDGGADYECLLGKSKFEGMKKITIGTDKETLEKLREMFVTCDPLYFIPHFSPRPLLLINGEADEIVPPPCIGLLHDAAKNPKDIKWYKTAHTIHFINSLLYSFRWLKEKFSSCSPKF